MHFPISRRARDLYGLDDVLTVGQTPQLLTLREIAFRLNSRRDLALYPEQAVRAGHLNALQLLSDALRRLLGQYRQEINPGVLRRALGWLYERYGSERVSRTMYRFLELFELGSMEPELSAQGEGALSGSGRGGAEALSELLVLWLINRNPAAAPFVELFDDKDLESETGYREMLASLEEFFAAEVPLAAGENLLAALRDPAREAPHSLEEQLRSVMSAWDESLEALNQRALVAFGVIHEEEKPAFLPPGPPGEEHGPPPQVYEFDELDPEPEAFSEDRDWMPSLVLMAKNTYVWLSQLSQIYGTRIARLDEIPDAELVQLARRGFTGLWLIGLWERSQASEQIKKLCGNPEAAASAYSLHGYHVAEDLGGEEACEALRRRAWKHGLRLACDMVPNHMGVDSQWLVEHPERFLSVPRSPFPSYSFRGPDLSSDPRVSTYLEDHYYDRTDAAVVFKRVDHRTGEERYVYHGNDGTSLPWNDTAQLDYLNPEAREAVIQTILEVARRFPVIRFDAAMTLARRHVQRLWYPPPERGGDIPSRAEHGLSVEEFNRRMPEEFWREVVDRVAQEAPDTLLLAEAFWLMEGYFVRTLGMHRVYNSAFMNMLRREENEKFRSTLKNTLDFDPEILKRFVNYATNPDEASAREQFGKGDKYFGVCTLMATLPGLPMFGHGQIEGLSEKYGMEYRRAYRDEAPDEGLVRNHEARISPLLRQRHLYAEVEAFRLYDFETGGGVCEDVVAYSNGDGDERALVLFHNRDSTVEGRLRLSVPWRDRRGGGEGELVRETLGEALGLEPEAGLLCSFRDALTRLEYLLPASALVTRGLEARLGPYEHRVLLDFETLRASEGRPYDRLAVHLAGRGVPSLEDALADLLVSPLQAPWREILAPGPLGRLLSAGADALPGELNALEHEAERRFGELEAALAKRASEETTVSEGSVGSEASTPDSAASAAREARLVRSTVEVVLRLRSLGSEPLEEEARPLGEDLGSSGIGSRAETEEPSAADAVDAVEPPANGAESEIGAAVEVVPDGETVSDADTGPKVADEAILDRVAVRIAGRSRVRADGLWPGLLLWALLRRGGAFLDTGPGPESEIEARSRALFDEARLGIVASTALEALGVAEGERAGVVAAVALFLRRQNWFRQPAVRDALGLARTLAGDEEVGRFLKVNRFDGVVWFHQEAFEDLLTWLLATAAAESLLEAGEGQGATQALRRCLEWIEALEGATKGSGFRMADLLARLGGDPEPEPAADDNSGGPRGTGSATSEGELSRQSRQGLAKDSASAESTPSVPLS